MGTARSNRDPHVVAAKLARLGETHVAPITGLVERIRVAVGHDRVPYVDPSLGGVNAKVMFLLETPAVAAALGSRMLSPDNDDATAANIWELYEASGLPRSAAVHWNAIPWFTGKDRTTGEGYAEEMRRGVLWLGRFIDLLSHLSLVITMGHIARRSFGLYLLEENARLVPWLSVAHPSPRVRNTKPALWKQTSIAFDKAAAVLQRSN